MGGERDLETALDEFAVQGGRQTSQWTGAKHPNTRVDTGARGHTEYLLSGGSGG